jgi:hypothetical protein
MVNYLVLTHVAGPLTKRPLVDHWVQPIDMSFKQGDDDLSARAYTFTGGCGWIEKKGRQAN